MNSFHAFGGVLTQGIDGNGCRRGVWQRLWAPLRFCVFVGLGMLHKHETSSNELVLCIWSKLTQGIDGNGHRRGV